MTHRQWNDQSREDCDDGASNGTAASCCDGTCHYKVAGTDCNDGAPGLCTGTSDICDHHCGDGMPNTGEDCDDGANNGTPQSCCTATCHFQTVGTDCNDGTPGKCTGASDTCGHGTCGDGTVGGVEQCDDGVNNGTVASCCDALCNFKTAGTVCNDGSPGICTGVTITCNHSGASDGTVSMGEELHTAINLDC